MQSKKFLSVLLTLLMMAGVIAVAPVTASAATPIEVSTAAELLLAVIEESGTIKLLADITCSDWIEINSKSIIFDLNGFTLNATGGVEVNYGGELKLANPNNGALNVSLDEIDNTALVVENGKAEVSSVTATGTDMGAVVAFESEVFIYGNVTCNATPTYDTCYGVYAHRDSIVTIEGAFTVATGVGYIHVESRNKTQAQYEATSTYPYLTYKGTSGSDTSYVYVKDTSAWKAVTVTGGTGGGNFLPGAAVAIVATVPAGKVFDGWTATGVTLTEAQKASASTSFTMPAGAVTVAAAFKDPPKYVGLFGKYTTYPSNFLNWFLFIVCFGFIWMWFF